MLTLQTKAILLKIALMFVENSISKTVSEDMYFFSSLPMNSAVFGNIFA